MERNKTRNKIASPLVVSAITLAALGYTSSASAQYAAPPSWMPMTMLTISLDANNHLQMVDQSTMLPRAPSWSPVPFSSSPVPLAINTYGGAIAGNPNLTATAFAAWDPAQPWSVLKNKAFSRQLGWWGGSGTAPATLKAGVEAAYGTGASIWIEALSQSAGLETYLAVGKYGVNANNTLTVDPLANGYTGIFGTGGSSTKWQWDYMMDHNTYAVSWNSLSPNQVYTANYKVYIGDSTGNELAAAVGASTNETWSWQAPAAIPAPVPEPETYGMMMAGLGLMGFLARRRKGASLPPAA